MDNDLIVSLCNAVNSIADEHPDVFADIKAHLAGANIEEENELLQMNQNYADDEKDLDDKIASIKDSISDVKRSLASLNGSLGNLIKAKTSLSAKRIEVYKRWNELKRSNDVRKNKIDALFETIKTIKGA